MKQTYFSLLIIIAIFLSACSSKYSDPSPDSALAGDYEVELSSNWIKAVPQPRGYPLTYTGKHNGTASVQLLAQGGNTIRLQGIDLYHVDAKVIGNKLVIENLKCTLNTDDVMVSGTGEINGDVITVELIGKAVNKNFTLDYHAKAKYRRK